MFPGRLKLYLWPTLLGEIQFHEACRQKNQMSRVVQRQAAPEFSRELIEHLIIRTMDPPSRDDIHRFEDALHAVFVA